MSRQNREPYVPEKPSGEPPAETEGKKSFSFQDTDIRDIDRSEIVDRKDIHIDPNLPQEERRRQFFIQSKGHPDCLIIDGVLVLSRFAKDGPTLEDCLCAAIRNAY